MNLTANVLGIERYNGSIDSLLTPHDETVLFMFKGRINNLEADVLESLTGKFEVQNHVRIQIIIVSNRLLSILCYRLNSRDNVIAQCNLCSKFSKRFKKEVFKWMY